MAELQLWRLRLLQGGPEALEAESWQRRAEELAGAERGMAELQIGRAMVRLREDDRAAVSLLWMPLTAPLDPWHCRRAALWMRWRCWSDQGVLRMGCGCRLRLSRGVRVLRRVGCALDGAECSVWRDLRSAKR